MSPTLSAIGKLSVAEQLSLVHELWDKIAVELERTPLSPEQLDEVDRRWQAHQQTPQASVPWEVVEREALARQFS